MILLALWLAYRVFWLQMQLPQKVAKVWRRRGEKRAMRRREAEERRARLEGIGTGTGTGGGIELGGWRG